jgi:hypothetical protein
MFTHASKWTALALVLCAACNQDAGEAPAEVTAAPVQAVAEPAKAAEVAKPEPTKPEAPKVAEADVKRQCAGICARSTELKCAQAAECEALCAASMADPTCAAQMSAATSCMLKEPAANWECTEDGVAAIKEGFCEAEQNAFATCLMAEDHEY